MIITILANGQVLTKEVLEGVIKNDCDLLVITSDKGDCLKSIKNINRNWREALKYINDDVILMDSNVVLKTGIVKKIKKELETNNIVVVPTNDREMVDKRLTIHGLMGMKKETAQEYKEFLKDFTGCGGCVFLNDRKYKVLWEYKQREIKR